MFFADLTRYGFELLLYTVKLLYSFLLIIVRLKMLSRLG